jgi:uncharacterized membrane protein
MAVTPTTLKQLFPAFASETDARVQLLINAAKRRVSEGVFGVYYDDAVSYLAAHLLARDAAQNGGKGAIASETVGSLSRSYSNATATTGGYGSTTYGQEFFALLRLVKPTPTVL